ncbi:MAG: PQQ-binding-like beta-propeller repeat protein [Thermoanaerobaculia bacterium]|nr:PQQ-binding-like beta-propeller repeat protein [Thermoanaerobaculia bacterium]
MRSPSPQAHARGTGRRSVGAAWGLAWIVASVSAPAQEVPPGAWTQWGGPDRNFVVDSPPLAEGWPEEGPPRIWSRPLGNGHSAILADDGRLFTMYRIGDPRSREGPWDEEEVVVAIDAASGETLWEHRYPSPIQDFGRGAGPHSTPLVAGDRLFTIGSNKRMHAFDKVTGEVAWSRDLVAEMGAPPLSVRPIVKSGYASSPIAWGDTVVCFVGGPGQSVVAFRQSDGEVVWRSGHFLISGGSPLLIDVDGEQQMVFFAGSLVAGLDPRDGAVLWAHAHDAGNDFNFSLPLWGEDGILFVSSAYRAGSRGIRLRRQDRITTTEELWFTSRAKFQFLNAVRIGDWVYGTHGESRTAFLVAVDVRTGEVAWRHRGFPQSSLLYADGKLIVLTEDGELALARVSPAGVEVLASTELFATRSWTVPTLVGTTLFARDRERIVALDLGAE